MLDNLAPYKLVILDELQEKEISPTNFLALVWDQETPPHIYRQLEYDDHGQVVRTLSQLIALARKEIELVQAQAPYTQSIHDFYTGIDFQLETLNEKLRRTLTKPQRN